MFFFRNTCSRTIQTPRHPVVSLFFATLSGLMLSQSALASNMTDLPASVLDRLESGISSPKGADLLAVEISEKTLIEMRYFLE
jgi:hypothetical protein